MSEEVPTDIDRRRLLGGVAAIGGAVPLLAACGGDAESNGSNDAGAEGNDDGGSQGDSSQGDGGSQSEGGDGDSGEAGGFTVEASEVPVGGGKIFSEGVEEGQEIVVTQPSEGEFKAFSAICTHNQCVVTRVNKSAIICDCHMSHYDPATGEVTSGPAPEPLPEKTVQQSGGTLTIT